MMQSELRQALAAIVAKSAPDSHALGHVPAIERALDAYEAGDYAEAARVAPRIAGTTHDGWALSAIIGGILDPAQADKWARVARARI